VTPSVPRPEGLRPPGGQAWDGPRRRLPSWPWCRVCWQPVQPRCGQDGTVWTRTTPPTVAWTAPSRC